MKEIKGGVTAPRGFLASGVKAGIKKSGRKDLALIFSETAAVAAAAFTTNRFQASPVKISKAHIAHKTHRAIIVNSGNANCANGKVGDRDAVSMAVAAAQALGVEKRAVLVASTGIIGHYLPIGNIHKAIPLLVKTLAQDGGSSFAESIMTTDTKKKECAVSCAIGGVAVRIGGSCKGVGMIYPEMRLERHATMLSFLTTDAAITKRMLEKALSEAIVDSFNMVSVDGDMSTNDSCFIMANGCAGNRLIKDTGNDYAVFTAALTKVTAKLAKMIAYDGEGATKLIEIEVVGAKAARDARTVARKISTSNLFKACVYGGDPNWGRVAAACGAAGVAFDPERTDIYLGGIKVMSSGQSVKEYDKKKARAHFLSGNISVKVDLKAGHARAKAWTCDLSKEYVAINSVYST